MLDVAVREVVQDELLNVHTMLPGRIEKYTASTGLADVLPSIRVNGELLPVLPSIPVGFPRSGNNWISLPVQVGDQCVVCFCEQSLDQWRALGGTGVDPGDPDRHSLSGAFCVPMLSPDRQSGPFHGTNLVIKCGPNELHVKPSGVTAIGSESPSDAASRASKTNSEITKLTQDINTLKLATGAIATALDGLVPGTSTAFNTATGAIPHSPESVASTKVLID